MIRSPGSSNALTDRGIGLRPGMRLDISVVGPKQFASTLDGQLLGNVDEFAAAVIALAGITFGVLVRQHRTLRFHNQRTRIVLGRNQFDVFFLATLFLGNRVEEFGIKVFQGL